MTYENKLLALVGLGKSSIPIIEKSKELGLKTLGFGVGDYLGNRLVDIYEEISIFDIDSMYDICLKRNVSGVIASSEITTESTAILANRLGLPGNEIKNGFCARNKYVMRQKISKLESIKQPLFDIYTNISELNIEFPILVKPVDSYSKKGIGFAKTKEDLILKVENAKKYSSNGMVLIEEYINGGKEYSIECISSNSQCVIVQITEKDSSGEPFFVETGHHQPAQIAPNIKLRIYELVPKILNALGIVCGMSHLELKIKNNDIYFIEVGARAGGDHIADTLTLLSTDYDYYKASIDASLGFFKNDKIIKNTSYSGIYFLCEENKRYEKLFKIAKKADWCVKFKYDDLKFDRVFSNDEMNNKGYFIYSSDHKIGIKEILEKDFYKNCIVDIINEYDNALYLLKQYYRDIKNIKSINEQEIEINKFLKYGNVITVIYNKKIIAMLNLYCNNNDTLEAYICNVEVIEDYRKLGLSSKILKKAINIAKEKMFCKIFLHVDSNNYDAICLYKKYGFSFNGIKKEIEDTLLDEMVLYL